MINREATIRYKGHDPDNLKPRSRKRVCMICDGCGRVRWGKMDSYRDLCVSCTCKRRKLSDEHKQKIGKSSKGRIVSDRTRKKISKSVAKRWNEHPEEHGEGNEKMRGGDDIIKHHYIYDDSDKAKYTVGITRSDHSRFHHLLNRLGYIVPHINIPEVL